MEITEERVRHWSRVACCMAATFSIAFLVQVYLDMPRFYGSFKAIRLDLPVLTKIVFNSQLHFLVWGIAIAGVIKESRIRDPIRSLNFNILQIVLILALKEVYCYAMLLPVLKIQDALQHR